MFLKNTFKNNKKFPKILVYIVIGFSLLSI